MKPDCASDRKFPALKGFLIISLLLFGVLSAFLEGVEGAVEVDVQWLFIFEDNDDAIRSHTRSTSTPISARKGPINPLIDSASRLILEPSSSNIPERITNKRKMDNIKGEIKKERTDSDLPAIYLIVSSSQLPPSMHARITDWKLCEVERIVMIKNHGSGVRLVDVPK